MSILYATLAPILVSHLDPIASVHLSAPTAAIQPAQTQTVRAETANTNAPLPAVIREPHRPIKVNPAALPGIAPEQAPAPVIQINAPAPAPEPRPEPQEDPAANFNRDDVVAKAATALSSVRTAEGRFTQQDDTGSAAGKFYISRPGKVRFDYTSPELMHIVSDGVSVSIDEPERDAFDAVPLASTQLSLFLRDDLDFNRDGNVTDVSASDVSYFLTLEDRSGEADGQMILEFRRADFELMGWRTVDAIGNQTFVSLSDVETGTRLRPSLFVVRDPADRADDRR